MKRKLVLSTHKLATKTASLLRSYCHLLKPQLHSNWIINNSDENSDVLIFDRLDERVLKSNAKAKIVLSNCRKLADISANNNIYQLCLPIKSGAIISLFNKISKLNNFIIHQDSPNKQIFSFRQSFSKFIYKLGISNKLSHPKNIHKSSSIVEKFLLARTSGKLKHLKVVFLGRPATGKTTAISAVSETQVLTSETNATDSVSLLKRQTTIGIDFGEYKLNDKVNLRLYGTPGQSRYDFVQIQTIKNSDIYIILLDINSESLLHDLNYFNNLITDTGNINAVKIVTLTHLDESNANRTQVEKDINKYYKAHVHIEIMDARDKKQVQNVLTYAASQVVP